MSYTSSCLRKALLFTCGLFLLPLSSTLAQVRPRVVEAVNNAHRVTLAGNVHPLARPDFDRGAVDDAQPMTRILLLLKRSDEQEAALQDALDKLQDKSSPTYHQWLSPEQFGALYGPADEDIAAVSQWLMAQGFRLDKVYQGKTVIEFSGFAGQVRAAFGASIRKYQINGNTYTANANDPQIPAALAPVVVGLVSLNSFPRAYHSRIQGIVHKKMGQSGLEPLYTFPLPSGSGHFYGLGPADFATIYGSNPLLSAGTDGTGQTIAIVGETNVKVQDVQNFRSMFGLSANFDASNVILNGEDPGITSTGEEGEADLDVEWSGAVAPGATVKFVVSASTPASAGVDLSALYIIEHNLAGVMSESYGGCESGLGTTGNAFYNSLWEQAAAQGITAIVSSGDNGSAGCDDFNTASAATHGLAVNGLASTPYNVAVGGTDFDDVNQWTSYWSTANNTGTGSSALKYIPEIPWNENCAQLGLTGCGASAPNGSLNIVAGSGGRSGVYTKPPYQQGTITPNDSHRDLPDVSLFASPGFDGTGYIYCQSDDTFSGIQMCQLNSGSIDFGIVGGTSAAAPAFAGVMALVNQKQASSQNPAPRQGNANYVLYQLAKKTGASCASTATEASTCIFNDVTHGNSALLSRYPGSLGTVSVPCQGGTPDCSVTGASNTGVLVDPAHTTTEAWTVGTGFDLATGLGSVNINNLATKWGTVSTAATATTLTLSPLAGITHGSAENVSVNITVSPKTATGDVSLMAKFADGSTQGLDQFALGANGVFTGTTNSLPGGTNFQVYAHYAGDGTNAPSDSAPQSVTVAPENSQTFIVIPSFDASGNLLNGNVTSVLYGSNYIIRMYVTNSGATYNPNGAPNGTCDSINMLTCPTGTVTLTDNGALVGAGGGGVGIFNLNGAGYTRYLTPNFLGGTHSFVASYSGDNSYQKSKSATTNFTVLPAPVQITLYPTVTYPVVGIPFTVNVGGCPDVSQGVAPTGTISLFDGTSSFAGPIAVSGNGCANGNPGLGVSFQVAFAAGGDHSLTASYSGDTNYAAATTAPVVVHALYATNASQTETATNINYGQSITVTGKITSSIKNTPMSGQVEFYGDTVPGNTTFVQGTPGTDGSGNQILTATATVSPQSTGFIRVIYSGDSNYAGASTVGDTVTVFTPDFSMPSTAAITVTAGQTGTATINVTPLSNVPSAVTMSVSGSMYGGMNLSLNPSTANLNGSTVPVTLTLTTTGPSGGPTSAVAAPQIRRAGLVGSRRRGWWLLSLTSALLFLYLLGIPGSRRRFRAAFFTGVLCAVTLALGCGGGTGGGGGGGGSPVPTSIAVTTSNAKVSSSGGSFTLTATVTSTKPITGTVIFSGAQMEFPYPNGIPVVNGVATYTVNVGPGALQFPVGTYTIMASYSGDASNQPSQTVTGVSEVFTGTTLFTIAGQTGTISHWSNVSVTLQ